MSSVNTDPPPEYKPPPPAPTIPVGVEYQPVTAANTEVTIVTAQPTRSGIISINSKPPNYLGLSLFTCLCCCWIVGLIALIFSLQVDSSWASGDVNGAKAASENARKLNIGGIICGSIIIAILVIFFIIGLATGGGDDDDDE